MAHPRRRYRTPEEIQRLVSSYHQSGLTAQEFSARHGVPLSSLQRYLRQHREADTPSSPLLIPADVAEPAAPELPSSRPSFELHLPDHRRLTIPSGFDAGDLARLLEVLGC
jgi:transposase-like protein